MKKNKKYATVISLCAICSLGLFYGCGKENVEVPQDNITSEAIPSEDTTMDKTNEISDEAANETDKENTQDVASDKLPIDTPLDFLFSSGAGAWGTTLVLQPDGTFSGSYSDSEMGDSGDGYPYGTVYNCEFDGQFTNITKIDDTSYSMTLEFLNVHGTIGEEKIEEEIRYVTQEPSGLTSGNSFIFYVPDTSLTGLSEDFLSWWPDNWQKEDEGLTSLGRYGLYNVADGLGFFTME